MVTKRVFEGHKMKKLDEWKIFEENLNEKEMDWKK